MTTFELTLIGVLIALGTFGIAYKNLRIGRKTAAIVTLKATSEISVEVHLHKAQVNSAAFPPFYFAVIRLDNHGELPSKKIDGSCKFFSPSNPSIEILIPIQIELLGSVPKELERKRLDGIFIDWQRPQAARIKAEIEFKYVSAPEGVEKKYYQQYEYDAENEQFRAIS